MHKELPKFTHVDEGADINPIESQFLRYATGLREGDRACIAYEHRLEGTDHLGHESAILNNGNGEIHF